MAMKHVTDLMVCQAFAEANRKRDENTPAPPFFMCGDYEYPYVILQRMTGECEKVCYRAMERACDRGLVEYGVSLRTGWLTKEGRELLAANEHSSPAAKQSGGA